jgi:DNA-binding response OmpR family regulator
VLAGTNGKYITARDSHGNEMPYEYQSYIEARDGYSLVTTLDINVQAALEEQLRTAYVESGGQNRATGIVVEVKTGEILAQATYPFFDLNDPRKMNEEDQATLDASGFEANSEEYDKLNGFSLGIDDYVVKPFSPKELMMRVDAVMKRYNSSAKDKSNSNETFEAGDLFVDITARIVYVAGERCDLSPKEYDLLFYLIKNKNIALSRDRLISEVWGYDYYGDDRTLDTHIKLLRKSLGESAKYIVTLRGVGYRFDTNTKD